MTAILRIASGVILVLVGLMGLILPIMPGWVFLIPGLVILSNYIPPLKRFLHWAQAKAKERIEKYQKGKAEKKPDA